ncbi:MAG TPA: anion transporter [Cryomorphaceae bacterium]|nr:anion transporter [Cryomorphaceae bacterium]
MTKFTSIIRWLGPILALLISLAGQGQSHFVLLGIAAWMLVWWITETVHLGVTALLPLLLFPVLELGAAKELAGYYAHPLVYLFFGGFILALALEKSSLHYRIALWILKRTGTKDAGLIAGFMLATGFMSMWISNTATAIMMLPIATSVLGVLHKEKQSKLSRPVLLSVAWAANIGGMATIIGTPPNMIFAAFMSEQLDRPIGFMEWLPVGLTATVILGITAFWIITRGLPKDILSDEEEQNTARWIAQEWNSLGGLTPVQKRVAVVFTFTATLWILRPYLAQWISVIQWSDTAIALASAVMLFALRDGNKGNILDWEDTKNLPWGILILFGGGLALAGTLQGSQWFELMSKMLENMGQLPQWVWLLIVAIIGVFATELLSNMALVSALLPLLLSLSLAIGIPMDALSLPLVLGASCAFMLPMATPPNAIVFSTGKLTISYMIYRGIVMNVLAIALIVLILQVVGITG